MVQRIVRERLGFVIGALAFAMIWGCAPALYSVDMKYVPTRPIPEMKGSEKKEINAILTIMRKENGKIVEYMPDGRVFENMPPSVL